MAVANDPFADAEPVSVRSLAVHPSGLHILLGCRQGMRVLSRVYTALADNLKLL